MFLALQRRFNFSRRGKPVLTGRYHLIQEQTFDRTLSVLLRYGLKFLDVIENYMPDEESGNAAALLEWIP